MRGSDKRSCKTLGRVLPKNAPLQSFSTKNEPGMRTQEETIPVLPSTSSPSSDVVFETPKKAVVEIRDDDDDDADVIETEENVRLFSRKHFGKIASPFLSPYLSNSRLLDT